jgi:hypothetical protein
MNGNEAVKPEPERVADASVAATEKPELGRSQGVMTENDAAKIDVEKVAADIRWSRRTSPAFSLPLLNGNSLPNC